MAYPYLVGPKWRDELQRDPAAIPEHLRGREFICVAYMPAPADLCAPHIADTWQPLYVSPPFSYPFGYADMVYFLRECYDEMGDADRPDNIDAQADASVNVAVAQLFDAFDKCPPRMVPGAMVRGPYGVTLAITQPCIL